VKNAFRVGDKIYFRALERADAAVLAPWMNDPEVTRQLTHYRPISVDQEEHFLGKLDHSTGDIVVGIVRKVDDQLLGAIGLHEIDARSRRARLGVFIGSRDEWGKGFGSEAVTLMVAYGFDTLNLNRIELHVYEYNERARRTYDRVGFKPEGVLRQHQFREGRFWDTIAMAILRDEWVSAKDWG
jgi:RimJ/RimL family protein N-acetyltransferase